MLPGLHHTAAPCVGLWQVLSPPYPRPCCLPTDFFATWCNGCQRSYPELCKIAMDPDMQKEVKFVKVCQLHSRPCY